MTPMHRSGCRGPHATANNNERAATESWRIERRLYPMRSEPSNALTLSRSNMINKCPPNVGASFE